MASVGSNLEAQRQLYPTYCLQCRDGLVEGGQHIGDSYAVSMTVCPLVRCGRVCRHTWSCLFRREQPVSGRSNSRANCRPTSSAHPRRQACRPARDGEARIPPANDPIAFSNPPPAKGFQTWLLHRAAKLVEGDGGCRFWTRGNRNQLPRPLRINASLARIAGWPDPGLEMGATVRGDLERKPDTPKASKMDWPVYGNFRFIRP